MSDCEECDDVLDEGFSHIEALQKAQVALIFNLGEKSEFATRPELKGWALGHIASAIEHTADPATILRYSLIKEKIETKPIAAAALIGIEIKQQRKQMRDAFVKCITRCIRPPSAR